MLIRVVATFLSLCACAAPVYAAQAEKFPIRPVRVVVPSTPGGGLDVMARIMAPQLIERWGQQVVIDNRAGAGGIIGTDIVAKSAPDGHTLLIVTTGFTTNPLLISKLPYKTPDDFEPITPVGNTPVVLVAHPSLPVRNAKELVALAKEQPGKLVFASSGTGTGGHLTMALLQSVANIKFNHVPYKGAGASTVAVVSGEAQLLFTATSAALPQIKAGRLRPLVVTSARRVSMLPDVPSVVDAGLPGCVMEQWYGFIAPAKTPKALIDRIYADILAVMKQPDVSARLQAAGFALNGMPPAQFRQYLLDEMKNWDVVIKEAGLRGKQ